VRTKNNCKNVKNIGGGPFGGKREWSGGVKSKTGFEYPRPQISLSEKEIIYNIF